LEAAARLPPPVLPEIMRSPASLTEPTPLPPPSDDPLFQARKACWDEFEAADLESRIALFLRTLDEPELMVGEMAFEMLNTLQHQMAAREERHRFEELTEALRRQCPDVYAEEAGYLLSWRIDNALALGDSSATAALARELALIAHEAIDQFFQTMEQLAYYGELNTLLDIMPVAWPRLKASPDIVPWAVDDLASRATDFLIFARLERGELPDAADPELLKQISTYLDINPKSLDEYLGYLTGRTERCWSMAEFSFTPRSERRGFRDEDEEDEDEIDEHTEKDPGRQNLIHLSAEFLGYLGREEKISYTRGEVGREQIVRYLLDRFDGELVPRPSMLESVLRPKKKPDPPPPPPPHWLCPDRDTLDVCLSRLCGFLSAQYYKATALFELIPAWLRFLEARGLIDASRREATLSDLSGLRDDLLKLGGIGESDPALQQAVEHWNEGAGPSARNH